jgi:hypothetical protein
MMPAGRQGREAAQTCLNRVGPAKRAVLLDIHEHLAVMKGAQRDTAMPDAVVGTRPRVQQP